MRKLAKYKIELLTAALTAAAIVLVFNPPPARTVGSETEFRPVVSFFNSFFKETAKTYANYPEFDPNPYPEHWHGGPKHKIWILYRNHDLRAMSQGNAGSCVGAATAKALECMHGIPFDAAWSYGRSRSYFGERRPYSAGSTCYRAANMTSDIGALPLGYYAALGYDFRKYDAARARLWQRGPPEELDAIASKYRTSGYVEITNWKELRGAISHGVPVIFGATIGFGEQPATRDSQGMLHSKWWSQWHHAQLIVGMATHPKNERVLVLNSWGDDWVNGPKWLGDEPDGSYWISRKDAEKILAHGDCWAILPIKRLLKRKPVLATAP